MNLNRETILDIYTFKRKKFLCLIKVNPKNQTLRNTCRCFSQEQWTTFDKKLEKVLTATDKINDKKFKFNLKPLIEVKVQRSKLSFKHFYKLLDKDNNDGVDFADQNLVFECVIDFQQEGHSNSSATIQEYEPKISDTAEALKFSSLPYEPYTPSTKKLQEYEIDIIKNNNINFLDTNGDRYSPEPLVDISLMDPNLAPSVPQYTPAPINDKQKYKENSNTNQLKEMFRKTTASIKKKSVIKSSTKLQRTECEYIPKSQEVATLNVPIYVPTPIEENPEKNLYNTNNITSIKESSKKIGGFSELVDDNNRDQQISKIEQGGERNLNYQFHSSFKKRSMTVDVIPVELLDIPVYIPTPLDEKSFQKIFKTNYMENNKERYEDGRLIKKKCPIITQNYTINNLTKINGNDVHQKNCDPYPVEENSTIKINVMQAALSSESFFTTEGKSLLDKKKLHKELPISLSEESVIRNLNVPFEAQRKENEFQSEIYLCSNENNKKVLNKYLKQDLRISDCGSKTVKTDGRTETSLNKTKSLTQERLNSLNNKIEAKKRKSSLKHKELFGTDDEDGDDNSCYKNNKNHSAPSENSASEELNVPSSSKQSKFIMDKSYKAKMERKLKEFIKDF